MAVRGPSGRPFATGLPPASGIRLAGARARAVRSGQASEPSSAASLGKNGCGEPAATSLEPGGCGPTQPERAVARRLAASEVVPRSADRPRGVIPRVESRASRMTYPKVSHTSQDEQATSVASSPRFPDIEEAVLAYWESDDTFRASVEQRDAGADGSNEFVFYDGPPFANGLPHYGHLLTGYVKDLIPRYQTMRGHKAARRF